jgi:glycosyltransferase involved in cell wall biosynthesis
LIQAFAFVLKRHPEARLFVAGREGTATELLHHRIRRAGLGASVHLLGPRDDAPDLLCAADVFVLPSRREGMPGSVIEAMALETPVVATDLPQVREVTGDNAALLVPAGDPIALATAIVESVDEPRARDARVQIGLERFNRLFTIEAAARGMFAFYERSVRKDA